MDLISGLAFLWDSVLMKIVPLLFVLTVIVFFHELGHFLVGRLCGIKVLVFSVGFGSELIGATDRHGTRWRLAAIPLGGYVKFLGDENAASVPDHAAVGRMTADERSMAFPAKSVARRAATVVAGPLANFILAVVIFAGVAYFGGRGIGDPVVASVVAGSPAEAAGFRPGDKVLALDGTRIATFGELQRYVSGRADTRIAVDVERQGEALSLTVTPRETEQDDGFGNMVKVPTIGLAATKASADFRTENLSALDALRFGVSETWFITERTVSFIGGIFAGRQDADQIGGIIRIGAVSSKVAEEGIGPLLRLTALLSISIGLLNLLPIPILDGGHLMFYAYEALRGRPLSERVQELGFKVGLVLVLSLMVFAFWNDIAAST